MLISLDKLCNDHKATIKGVIHIGAHYGEEYDIYKNNNIHNMVMFEPLSDNFRVLTEKLKDKNIILVNKALGETNQQISMYVETVNRSESSSILKPVKHLVHYPQIVFDKQEIVEMIRLDDFDMDISQYNFINIDVQGYELQVFKGAKNILKHIDYIYSEVNNDELYENCTRVEELDSFLKDYGFSRVETKWVENMNWGDAFYIKNI